MTRDSDPYEPFAPIYDRWQVLHSAPFSAAMLVRMRQALDEWGAPDDSLLDIACGTGTLAWWWAQDHPGWTVWGVDRSADMIARAKLGPLDWSRSSRRTISGSIPIDAGRSHRRLDADRVPHFEVQDMTRLELPRAFGMATCFFDSLNHVVRKPDLEKILQRVRRALLPGGLFLFDLIDEDSFQEIFTGPWIVQGDGLYVATESDYYVQRGVEYGRVGFTFFEEVSPTDASGAAPGDSLWRRRNTVILERCWRREEFDPIVEKAGLEIIHVQLIDPEEQEEVFVPRRLYVCRPA